MVMKGVIPWTDDSPISCILLNSTSFDVLAQSTGRKYHLTATDADSNIWISLINAAIGIILLLFAPLVDISTPLK
jgi:hypothetical protein